MEFDHVFCVACFLSIRPTFVSSVVQHVGNGPRREPVQLSLDLSAAYLTARGLLQQQQAAECNRSVTNE